VNAPFITLTHIKNQEETADKQNNVASQVDKQMSNYVKLTSSEGAEFFVHRDCANVSQTIGAMLSGEFCFFLSSSKEIIMFFLRMR
jgi:hypothetical protein